jgi:DNA-binding MarR family transcriptional regulator
MFEIVPLVNLMLDIDEYLKGEGAAAILLRLDVKHGRLNGELDEVLHISSTTLSDHLTEAQRLDLIQRTRLPDDHGNSQRYVLTERGKAVVSKLQEHGLEDTYEKFFQAHEDLEASKSEVRDWVEDSTVTHPDYPPESDQPERP